PLYQTIQDEFTNTYLVRRVTNLRRRYILQIIHSTRALDSALKIFTAYHGRVQGHSLGKYLGWLVGHASATLINHLSTADRHRFRVSIVDRRNMYMHEAGSYPVNDNEITTLLTEMQDCVVTVLAL